MKTLSTALKTHLAQEVTTLATCWKLTRRDGTVLGFTDHDQDIAFDGLTYEAATGFTPTAVESSAALNVDTLDIEGMLAAAHITEADLLAGRYDFAEIEVFLINYAAPQDGSMILRTGWLGEVRVQGGRFVAELRGLTQQLAQRIGELYSPACRADLGDARCQVNLSGVTVTGTVGSASGNSQFTDETRDEESGYFAGGVITFTSGGNAGLQMEIKAFTNGQFVLVLPMPYVISAGDDYEAVAGCDKTLATCVQRFDNAVNFRGEPHVPGTDRVLETAGTRSAW